MGKRLSSNSNGFGNSNRKDKFQGDDSGDVLTGTHRSNKLFGGDGDDTIEAGAGNDFVDGKGGDDLIYAFSWAGEPDIAQNSDAEKVEVDEPIPDNDTYVLSEGEDTVTFRWLLDAKEEILDSHRDDTGDVDYQAVAGENDNTHDHWVEGMGDDTVVGYDPEEDTLVFEGHTVTLDSIEFIDADNDREEDDSVAYFYSEQGGAGAHQGDELGSVTFIDYQITAAEIDIDANVFYGIEDPWTATG